MSFSFGRAVVAGAISVGAGLAAVVTFGAATPVAVAITGAVLAAQKKRVMGEKD